MTIEFFGSVDRDPVTRQVRSTYPAWYSEGAVGELEATIEETQRRLDGGRVPRESVEVTKNRLEMDRAKLEAIKASKPTLPDAEKDKVAKAYKELGEKIGESMFTHSDMMRGLASPHEELKRENSAHIRVPKEIADACNIKLGRGGVASRKDAAKAWKIMGKVLGEPTNTEYLRRP